MMMNSHIGILARKAELGAGKRRLAKTLGDAATFKVYRHLIQQCAAAVAGSGIPTTVFFSPEAGDADIWKPDVFAKADQHPGDLGDRIQACAKTVLTKVATLENGEDSQPKALVIGTDCPELTPEILQEASRALDTYDCVLGPTFDGGYYLLGVKVWHEAYVENIAWSTEAVAEQTRTAILGLGQSCYELPTLNDIDEASDWDAYRKRSGQI